MIEEGIDPEIIVLFLAPLRARDAVRKLLLTNQGPPPPDLVPNRSRGRDFRKLLLDAGWHFVKLDCIVRFMQRNGMTREPTPRPWFRQVQDEDTTQDVPYGLSTNIRKAVLHQSPNLSGSEICRTWRHQRLLCRGTSGALWGGRGTGSMHREGWLNRLECPLLSTQATENEMGNQRATPAPHRMPGIRMNAFLKNLGAFVEMDSNEGRHRGSGDWCSLDIMLAF